MCETGISLDQLKKQLAGIEEDKRKTTEKMFQILGAIKVLEYLLTQCQEPTTPKEEVKENAAH